MALELSANQDTFARVLAQKTGLNLDVIAAWLRAEEPAENSNSPSQGLYNFLNIGVTGSGNYGTSDSVWTDPTTAAEETAAWLTGKTSVPGFGTAAAGIQAIAKTAGESAQAQIAAIQVPSSEGGWSGGGEPALPGAYQDALGGISTSGTPYVSTTFQASPPIIGGTAGKVVAGVASLGLGFLAPELLAGDGLGLVGEGGEAATAATTAAGAAGASTLAGEEAAGGLTNSLGALTTAGGLVAFFELFKNWLPKAAVFIVLLGLSGILVVTAFRRTTSSGGAS